MNEFLFDQSPWEAYLNSYKAGSTVPTWNLVSMLEDEDDEAVEDAFSILANRHLALDISTLPQLEMGGQTAQRLRQEAEYVRSGLRTADMDECDPLRLYLEEIAGTPAFGDDRLLPEQLLSGDENAAERLANLGLSRVIEIACEYAGKMVLLMDLIQEGNIGLWEAIQSYTGGDYEAHRDRLIRNAMCKAMVLQARSSGISQKMRQSLQHYQSADEALLTELGRNPTLEEIAVRMGISPEQAQTIQKTMADILLLQQAEKLAQPKEETPEDELAVEDTAYFQMRQRISDLLSQLDEKDAQILTMRFGLDKGLPVSAEEVGRTLGLTVGEVSEREAAALAKLRADQ